MRACPGACVRWRAREPPGLVRTRAVEEVRSSREELVSSDVCDVSSALTLNPSLSYMPRPPPHYH